MRAEANFEGSRRVPYDRTQRPGFLPLSFVSEAKLLVEGDQLRDSLRVGARSPPEVHWQALVPDADVPSGPLAVGAGKVVEFRPPGGF